jgi:hypothetical protein
MKAPTVSLMVVLAATLSSGCKPEGSARANPPPTEANAPAGHYCNLGAFTPAEHARHKELVPLLAASIRERRELPDGYALSFSGQFKEAGEFVDGARRCCPTLHYQLDFEPQGGPVWLRITGGAGAKDFIREEFRQILSKDG